MNKLILLAFILPAAAFGQKSEIGINGGIATNTAPTGTIYYLGNNYSINESFGMYWLKKINNSNISVGGGIYGVELANASSKVYNYFGTSIGNNGLKFTYAKYAYSVGPIVNYTFLKHRGQSFYVGGNGGFCVSRTEGQTENNSDGSKKTFRGIDGGLGFAGGLHLGMDITFLKRMAVNIDAGAEYYKLSFSLSESFPTGKGVSLQTFAFPLSIGIKYRMGFVKQLDYKTGKFIIPDATYTKEPKKTD